MARVDGHRRPLERPSPRCGHASRPPLVVDPAQPVWRPPPLSPAGADPLRNGKIGNEKPFQCGPNRKDDEK